MLNIGVDAVGGDHFPEAQIKGSLLALEEDPELKITLFGPEEVLHSHIAHLPEYQSGKLQFIHAPQIVGMDESASSAVKSKPHSSIAVALSCQKEGKCDAFVSAGNTGALLAASMLLLGKLDGVSRPTIGAVYPTLSGFRLLVDAGANLELRPEHYVQFARMGVIYVREMMGIPNPKVGLLNVGEEAEKGTEELREAYKALSDMECFVGNIEGRDIFPAKADVFLCDGMLGNVLLKFGESIPEALSLMIAKKMKEKNLSPETQHEVVSLLKEALQAFNYEHVGGVPFLGVNGVSMVGHGGSTSLAIKNMIINAAKYVRLDLNKKIVDSLQKS